MTEFCFFGQRGNPSNLDFSISVLKLNSESISILELEEILSQLTHPLNLSDEETQTLKAEKVWLRYLASKAKEEIDPWMEKYENK